MSECRLLKLLACNGYITDSQIEVIEGSREREGRHVTELLLSQGCLTHDKLEEFFSSMGIPIYDSIIQGIKTEAVASFPGEYASRYHAFPFAKEGNRLFIAMADPLDYEAIDNMEFSTKHVISASYAKPEDVQLLINKHYGNNAAGVNVSEDDLPVRLIDTLIRTARLYNASDIHIEPNEEDVRVRFRIDGRLQEHQRSPSHLLPFLISRLKIMGGMDISEKRLPQDGHFKLNGQNGKIDFRLSTIPTIHGEKAVIRLIYDKEEFHSLDRLGFLPEDINKVRGLLLSPNGAILVTGPAGSGKTTTLSCFIRELNRNDINIVTVEDPVENIIPGVNQISINEKANLNFAGILPYILRQDPDVIMIGEIRDEKTARIAIRSAITGHLVLSTLHTSDTIGAIVRLSDMGIEKYLIADAVKGIVSQRLAGKICDNCKEEARLTPQEAGRLGLPQDAVVYHGRGCPQCYHTGYKGRIMLYEILALGPELKELLDEKSSRKEFMECLRRAGSGTLMDNGVKNLLAGNTTVAEIYKNLIY